MPKLDKSEKLLGILVGLSVILVIYLKGFVFFFFGPGWLIYIVVIIVYLAFYFLIQKLAGAFRTWSKSSKK